MEIKNLENIKEKSYLEVNLITGRKHQIRAQLSNVGFPIIGDKKYGENDKVKRFYLCCYYIAFDEYVFELKNKYFV